MMYQASKKTDFTVDLIWWGSLRLAPIKNVCMLVTLIAISLMKYPFLWYKI